MVDRKIVFDSVCSVICSIISIIGLIYSFELQDTGDQNLFFVSIIIWIIVLTVSVIFIIWTYIEYRRNG